MSGKEKLKKVLIVDDEEDILWSLQNNLCNDSLQVEIAAAADSPFCKGTVISNRMASGNSSRVF